MSEFKANRLLAETSPYLQQHAYNPVDWFPWSDEALEQATRLDRPVFLSIGYSACHWCHVMEHESFEDEQTAQIMNDHFINIKVDREERPDLDHIYMAAVQMMTQHGGWPMSVFLTPKLEPFWGGTYFPPEPRMGMPGFKQVLLGVADAWANRRDEVTQSAEKLTANLQQINNVAGRSGQALSLELLAEVVSQLSRIFDPAFGGFGSAPKFPHPMDLKVCLRHAATAKDTHSLEMATITLDGMSRGGIYDQLGGGFHRYATDERWLVPHFEKMLYDNALLTQVYLEAHQATGDKRWSVVAKETLDYVIREMTDPEGGFRSTQDADSEGVEGKFFVWSEEEVNEVLDEQAARWFCYAYDVSLDGNWEGHNILQRLKPFDQCAEVLGADPAQFQQSIQASRARLLEQRSKRIAPGRDDKILVSWNGLMIDAMARGHGVLGDPGYLHAARAAAEFMLDKMWANSGTGRLLHSFKDGKARFNGYLEDYANLIDGLVSLYEASFEQRWLESAQRLATQMVEQFWDDANDSFFYTGRDHEKLIARTRDVYDGATPSGNSMAITGLTRLGRLVGNLDWLGMAERTLVRLREHYRRPTAGGQFLVALDLLLNEPKELVISPGDDAGENDQVVSLLWQRFLPNKVLARANGESAFALMRDKPARQGNCTLYVCENYSCSAPEVGVDAIRTRLDQMAPCPIL